MKTWMTAGDGRKIISQKSSHLGEEDRASAGKGKRSLWPKRVSLVCRVMDRQREGGCWFSVTSNTGFGVTWHQVIPILSEMCWSTHGSVQCRMKHVGVRRDQMGRLPWRLLPWISLVTYNISLPLFLKLIRWLSYVCIIAIELLCLWI